MWRIDKLVRAGMPKGEAESKQKHGVWDMPELTIISPYVLSRVDSNTFTNGQPYARVDLNLCESRLHPPVRDFGFGLWASTGLYLYDHAEKRLS